MSHFNKTTAYPFKLFFNPQDLIPDRVRQPAAAFKQQRYVQKHNWVSLYGLFPYIHKYGAYKMLLRKFVPFISIFLLAGCVAYKPKPISPAETLSSFEARTLDNPGLKEFMEMNIRHEILPWPPEKWDFEMLTFAAFYYHPDLDVARAKWAVAEAGVITGGQVPNPGIGFGADYTTPGDSPWTYGLSLDIPIETAGKRGYRIVKAERLSAAAKLGVAETAWNVRSRLRSRFIEHLLSIRNLELLKAEEAIRAEYVSLLEVKLGLGDIPRTDVESARINLNRARLIVQSAEGRVDETRILLAEGLGIPVPALTGIVLSYPQMGAPPPVEAVPDDSVRREALLNRLDIRRALSEYAAAEAALQLEIARQYPDIKIGPGYQWSEADNQWSLGVSLTLPIFNRNEGPIAEANARRDEAAARFLSLQTRVIAEINKAVANYNSAVKEYETAANLLSSTATREMDIGQAFALGDLDYTAVIGARLETAIARRSLIDAFKKAQIAFGGMEDAVQRPLEQGLSMPAVPETNPRAQIPSKEKVSP